MSDNENALVICPASFSNAGHAHAEGCSASSNSSRLGGHLKTGQTWPLQNRPTKLSQNKSIYNPPMAVSANLFSQSVPKSLY
jgi:hypothetical protein